MSLIHEQHDVLASDMRAVLADRLGAATITATLSGRGNKTLSLMEEPDGRQFVSRVYEYGAELEIENDFYGPGLPFKEGLEAMSSMYQSAGLDVVKSSVLPEDEDDRVAVISEYLPNAVDFRRAPTETKEEVMKGLAKLLDPANPYLPGSEAMVSDMFLVTPGEDGKQHAVVVDVDPRLRLKKSYLDRSGRLEEMHKAAYITQVSSLIESFWAYDEEEAADLARAFLKGLSTIDDESLFNGGMAVLEAVTTMHGLTQVGLSRHFRL